MSRRQWTCAINYCECLPRISAVVAMLLCWQDAKILLLTNCWQASGPHVAVALQAFPAFWLAEDALMIDSPESSLWTLLKVKAFGCLYELWRIMVYLAVCIWECPNVYFWLKNTWFYLGGEGGRIHFTKFKKRRKLWYWRRNTWICARKKCLWWNKCVSYLQKVSTVWLKCCCFLCCFVI